MSATLSTPSTGRPAVARPRIARIARYRTAYLWLIPTFALLLVFNYYPALSALYHSLFQWNGANIKLFVGVSNFVDLWHDPLWWESFTHLIILTVALVAINLTFPLGAAAMIFHLWNLRAAYFYRVPPGGADGGARAGHPDDLDVHLQPQHRAAQPVAGPCGLGEPAAVLAGRLQAGTLRHHLRGLPLGGGASARSSTWRGSRRSPAN